MLVTAATTTTVFRFAPSPTGALHLGHARSALIGQAMARAMGGRFLLRIEDIDTTRLRPEFIDWIVEDLAWIGVAWEQPVLRQSMRLPMYAAALRRLDALGLTYRCFATRSEIAAARDPAQSDPDGVPIYPGLWRGRSVVDTGAALRAGLPFAIRLNMQKAVAEAARRLNGQPLTFQAFNASGGMAMHVSDPARWGDVVIARKETPTSYHLAVVVDDAAQGVTHVTRGMDLLAATDVHRLLQVLLDLPEPLYHHHPLILDADGRKLSKSAGSTSLRDLRAAGVNAHDVIARALSD